MSPRLPHLVDDGAGLGLVRLFADPSIPIEEAFMAEKNRLREGLWSLAEFSAWLAALAALLLALAVL